MPCKETSFLNHIVDSVDGDRVKQVMTRLITRESFGWCLFAVKAFSVVFVSTILVERGLCLLFVDVSRPHAAGIPQHEGSARRRDFYLQKTDIHVLGGIRARDPSNRAAADARFRPRGHWDRQLQILYDILILVIIMLGFWGV